MAFKNGCYASVWEIEPAANYTDVKITISKKNQATGRYEQDFVGKVRFIGDAHINIQKYPHKPEERKPITRLRLDDVSATITSYKPQGAEKEIYYNNYQCYAFSPVEQATTSAPTAPQKQTMENIPEDVDEELPFN